MNDTDIKDFLMGFKPKSENQVMAEAFLKLARQYGKKDDNGVASSR